MEYWEILGHSRVWIGTRSPNPPRRWQHGNTLIYNDQYHFIHLSLLIPPRKSEKKELISGDIYNSPSIADSPQRRPEAENLSRTFRLPRQRHLPLRWSPVCRRCPRGQEHIRQVHLRRALSEDKGLGHSSNSIRKPGRPHRSYKGRIRRNFAISRKKEGKISEIGTYEELMTSGKEFHTLITTHVRTAGEATEGGRSWFTSWTDKSIGKEVTKEESILRKSMKKSKEDEEVGGWSGSL